GDRVRVLGVLTKCPRTTCRSREIAHNATPAPGGPGKIGEDAGWATPFILVLDYWPPSVQQPWGYSRAPPGRPRPQKAPHAPAPRPPRGGARPARPRGAPPGSPGARSEQRRTPRREPLDRGHAGITARTGSAGRRGLDPDGPGRGAGVQTPAVRGGLEFPQGP